MLATNAQDVRCETFIQGSVEDAGTIHHLSHEYKSPNKCDHIQDTITLSDCPRQVTRQDILSFNFKRETMQD